MNTLRFVSDDFYSDQVWFDDDIKKDVFKPLSKPFTVSVKHYLDTFEEHLNAVRKASNAHSDTKDIRVSWNPTTRHITMHGTQPWTSKQIEAFKKAEEGEKDEIKQLRELVRKYPGKAVDAIAYLLEEAKHSKDPKTTDLNDEMLPLQGRIVRTYGGGSI